MSKPTLNLVCPAFTRRFGRHNVKGRTVSAAMLAWFLDNYYHLEATEVSDSICDKKFDKGVDGIYVSDLLQQVDIFSAVIGTANPVQDLGDTDLKDLLATVGSWFKDGDSVRSLEQSATANVELKHLLDRLKVAKKLDDGYQVRPVFVTNKKRDDEAIQLLAQNPQLILWDGLELKKHYFEIDKAAPIATQITFSVGDVGVLPYSSGSALEMAIAPLLASELVLMEGIASQELFAWNVRYRLKRSPINKAIDKSVQEASEHKYFPAFHNGLTVLCKTLKATKKRITISGYAVVNGCQSLSSLYENSSKLTPDLRILTKFIKVEPTSPLALKITDYTNSQNGTSARDRQSNNIIHSRLQTQVHDLYSSEVFYRIARGERPDWDSAKVIDNEDIARVLLAFDIGEPESCHQTYRLFKEFHSKIFGRPEVNADRLVALFDVDQVILGELKTMSHALFADYTQTHYLFHYLTREALETDELGRQFILSPSEFVHTTDGRNRLKRAINPIVSALMRIMDADLKRRENENEEFDFKKDLKSKTKIGEIRSRVIPQYQMSVDSRMTLSFSNLWNEVELNHKL
jgi:hypothetical protein